MSNPPKKKGTAYETEVLRALNMSGLVRTPPGSPWDMEKPGKRPCEILVTRPDYGDSLVTLRLVDFRELWGGYWRGLRVECKRYKKFAHHSIYNETFNGSGNNINS